ncbi:hypothetical protein GCM10007415_23050 [Parapedobacter pyrenivorans]|uniref:Uncharacterized protein n=1 Tax=Parapedobacter pyrenivorans TaxID=1305674 RepID=A0A917MCD8_9SPHI|nr:DUF6266 family protein [Parapedobacter pyrenivorans]GGG88408.1 hypothetical protein GCM10007415_23050 [Parapedobacter pyrenivorans]
MAKFINGAIGTFSGKVGSIIGSSWRNIHYMRGLPKKRTKPFSEAQLAQQQRFGLMGKFLLPLKGLFEIGLANLDDGEATLFNQAMGMNLPAVTGSYPEFTIDYGKVQFSKGGLLKPRGVTLTAGAQEVTVAWRPGVTPFNGHADDDVYLLLYDRELEVFYTTDEVVQRSVGEAVVPIDDDTVGHDAEVWLFCVSRDGASISETVYGGSVLWA